MIYSLFIFWCTMNFSELKDLSSYINSLADASKKLNKRTNTSLNIIEVLNI